MADVPAGKVDQSLHDRLDPTALLNIRGGNEITVVTPGGTEKLEIIKVENLPLDGRNARHLKFVRSASWVSAVHHTLEFCTAFIVTLFFAHK